MSFGSRFIKIVQLVIVASGVLMFAIGCRQPPPESLPLEGAPLYTDEEANAAYKQAAELVDRALQQRTEEERDLLLQEVIALYSKILQDHPADYAARVNRSTTYSLIGAYDLALADVNQALKVEKQLNAIYQRANVYLALGEQQLALQDFYCVEERISQNSRLLHLQDEMLHQTRQQIRDLAHLVEAAAQTRINCP